MNIKLGNLRLNAAVSLIILASILYFFKLGSFSLYDAAETTYGEFTKNILQMNDWLTLHYNGGVIFDKPPLYYWLAALMSRLVGFNEWAMRCWAALAGVLTVLTTYAFGKKLYNERVGLLSGVIVMTAFQFLVQARIAELDIVLTLFMTLSLWLWYEWYSSGNKTFIFLAYLPLAFGLLIKGLLAIALPACAVFFFLLFKKELPKLQSMRIVPGLLIIALIGLPWYIMEYLVHGRVFLDFALGFLFLSRFQGVVAGHTGPWYYYFIALLLGFAPWSHFLPLGLWRSFRNWRNDPELLSLCFILPAFIVFSVAKTKIPNYILPLYPFLAIMVGKLWDDCFHGERRGLLTANIFFAIVIGLIFFGVMMVGKNQYPAQYASLVPALQALAATLIIGSAASIIFFFRRSYVLSFTAIPAMVFVIALLLTTWVLPLVDTFKGAKPLGAELARLIKPGQKIAAYSVGNRPSVVLYSPQPVIFLATFNDVRAFRGYIFTTTDEYEKIKAGSPNARLINKKGDLLVFFQP